MTQITMFVECVRLEMSATTREYAFQDEAVEALFKHLAIDNSGHPLIVAPTGSGKTHILSKIISRINEQDSNARVLVLSHTKEILEQDYEVLCEYMPRDKIGLWSSGLKLRQRRKYTIAGIQSVFREPELFAPLYPWVIIDEAHLIPPKGEGMYRSFLRAFNCPIIGLTATPFRRGHGYLTENHIFSDIVYDIPIDKLIKEKYLCNLVAKLPGYEMSTKGVKVIAGDYSKAALSRKLDNKRVTNKIIPELLKYKDLRKKWLIFAIDIDHAEHIAEQLRQAGILAAAVHSRLKEDRDPLLYHFKRGDIQALVNVETLTTGFNVPDIDMIALLRPTQSPVLHVQMVGRGLRIADGKENCLVLDFSGNIARLGPINNVHVPVKKKKGDKDKSGGPAPVKVCEQCRSILPINVAICPDCGYVFPIKTKLSERSSELDIIETEKAPRLVMREVKNVAYTIHRKRTTKPPTLRVTYDLGLSKISEWIGIEHDGYPKVKAMKWWRERSDMPFPKSVYEAQRRSHALRKPRQLGIIKISQYPEIVRYVF